MDASDTRRGRPTAHRRLAGAHRGRGGRGCADHFGVSAAVLLGDACFAWARQLLLDGALPDATRLRFAHLATEGDVALMAGQYLDLAGEAGGGCASDARVTARYKTTGYTIERPLRLGTALAAPGADVPEALHRFAVGLGEAFQLRDDVLGTFGDPAVTGKPVTDDIRAGKQTQLVALTRRLARRRDVARLDRVLAGRAASPRECEAVRRLMVDSGALAAAEARIEELAGAAHAALDGADLDAVPRAGLGWLATASTARAA